MVGLHKYSLTYGPINLTSVIYGSSNVNCKNVKMSKKKKKKNPPYIPIEYMIKASRSWLGECFFSPWVEEGVPFPL